LSIFLNTTGRLGVAHDDCCDEGCDPRAAFVRNFISTEESTFEALRNLPSIKDNIRERMQKLCKFNCWAKIQMNGTNRHTIEEKTERE
jgi:hypothetical protein